MKNLKYIIISSIIIFAVNFPAHFFFDFVPLKLTGWFFPVNESIFQHMKMIFTSFFIVYIIFYLLRRRFNFKNVFFSNLIASLSCICIFLIIYLPVYLNMGENMIFTLILLFICIFLGQLISSYFIFNENKKDYTIFSIILIIMIFLLNILFTYKPLSNFFFYDPQHKTYDIVYK